MNCFIFGRFRFCFINDPFDRLPGEFMGLACNILYSNIGEALSFNGTLENTTIF